MCPTFPILYKNMPLQSCKGATSCADALAKLAVNVAHLGLRSKYMDDGCDDIPWHLVDAAFPEKTAEQRRAAHAGQIEQVKNAIAVCWKKVAELCLPCEVQDASK